MTRLPVPPGETTMRLEHFVPRAASREGVFEWANLLGVCWGDAGLAGQRAAERAGLHASDRRACFHCDNFKGQLPPSQQHLELNPARAEPDVGRLFSYTYEGEIRPAKDIPEPRTTHASEAIDRLNLNVQLLKENRRAVIEQVRSRLQREPRMKKADVKRLLEEVSSPGADRLMRPYCQVAIVYLEKKFRQWIP